jgi:undecaprenyl-diphosphatase
VQGVTEFLPVSSSGHLVLGGALLGLKEPHILFDVALHAATLVAVLIYYRENVAEILRHSLAATRDLGRGASVLSVIKARPGAWLMVLLVVGSAPTALVGLAFKHKLEALFANPRAVACAMLGTAAILLATRFVRSAGRNLSEMSTVDALVIGLVQGIAIIPGLSRSGSTIGSGVILGLKGELAARYSFLLCVPAILGAVVLKLHDAEGLAGVDLPVFGVGCLVAFLSGFAALKLFIPLVRGGHLHWFAPYLVLVGGLALFLLP